MTQTNENQDPNVSVNVWHGIGYYDSLIPKANKIDTKTGFKFCTLTLIKRKPTYEPTKEAKRQLMRNTMAVKVSFGEVNIEFWG